MASDIYTTHEHKPIPPLALDGKQSRNEVLEPGARVRAEQSPALGQQVTQPGSLQAFLAAWTLGAAVFRRSCGAFGRSSICFLGDRI